MNSPAELMAAFGRRRLAIAAGSTVSFVGIGQRAGTSATAPAHIAGDLFLAVAMNTGGAIIPTLPSGWTSLATNSSTPAVLVCYKVAVGSSEVITGFTNATLLQCGVYRGAGVPGTPSLNRVVSTSIDYNALTLVHSDGSSWVMAQGTADDTVANMTTDGRDETPGTATSGGGDIGTASQSTWLADTNAGVTSWSVFNNALSASHRWRTVVVEIPSA